MLDVGLSIVKVSIDGDHISIVPRLSGHLQFLHLADTVFWIKDDDLCSWNIGKTGHSSFSCITRSRCQDDNLVFQTVLFSCCCHKVWQDGQGHILKGNGRAVEKFQVVLPIEFDKRSNSRGIKLAVISMRNAVVQLFCRKVVQEG